MVLCSGGLDSVVAACVLRAAGAELGLLFVDYGQKGATREHLTVSSFVGKMEDVSLLAWKVDGLFSLSGALLKDASVSADVATAADLKGEVAELKGRNLLLCGLATGIALSRGYEAVAHGNINDGIYPDNRPQFTARFNYLSEFSFGKPHPMLIAPLGHLRKWQVIRLGHQIKVPFERTWSCYFAGELHCGECGSCQSRKRAFAIAKVTDPIKYAA